MQSVVRAFSLSFSHYQCLTPTSELLDSPEIAPGAILGASGASGAAGATVPASGTRSGATSSFFNEPSSNAKPTSSSKSKSSSNLAPIIGGVVGGVAVIALLVTTIAFIMQRGRSEASAPVAPPFVGAYQPPMDEIQQPLTVGDGYAASTIPGTIGSSTSIPGTPVSPMRIYVRVSCPIPSRFYVCLTHALSYPYLFFF